jgi:hypothetical protein
MDGGYIGRSGFGNTAIAGQGGGGVFMQGGAVFTMSNGAISGNAANGGSAHGGGVYLAQSDPFTMMGGSITDDNATPNNLMSSGVTLYRSDTSINAVYDNPLGTGPILATTPSLSYGTSVALPYYDAGSLSTAPNN